MIDVQIFIERLELLRERLLRRIDFGYDGFYMDINQVPQMSVSKIIQIFNETGILYVRSN